MANPQNQDWELLKRVARYLISHRRLVHTYEWQDEGPTVSVYTGSNWAGCLKTRKSTSGACLFNGNHLIRSYAKTQATIALSSGEAELYATVMASSEGLGLRAMMLDFGIDEIPHLFVDASAAIGICQRKGLGKIRHLDTQSLWIQDALRERRLSINKVLGTENPSDAMTKFLDGNILAKMLNLMNCHFIEGRPESAPQLAEDAAVEDVALSKAPTSRVTRRPTFATATATAGPRRQDLRPAARSTAPGAAAAAAAAGQQHSHGKYNKVSRSKKGFVYCLADWSAWPVTDRKHSSVIWTDE